VFGIKTVGVLLCESEFITKNLENELGQISIRA